MNQYDPRIKNEHCIRDPFNVETAKQYIGKRGYFTDDIFNFSNLDNCCDGMLVSIETDDRHPYYCGISDEGVIIKGNFSFFLSAEFVEEKPKEKKYRPFTDAKEFFIKTNFEVGDLIHIRSKPHNHEYHLLIIGWTDEGLMLGNFSEMTFDELLDKFELWDEEEGNFKPFGTEDTE